MRKAVGTSTRVTMKRSPVKMATKQTTLTPRPRGNGSQQKVWKEPSDVKVQADKAWRNNK